MESKYGLGVRLNEIVNETSLESAGIFSIFQKTKPTTSTYQENIQRRQKKGVIKPVFFAEIYSFIFFTIWPRESPNVFETDKATGAATDDLSGAATAMGVVPNDLTVAVPDDLTIAASAMGAVPDDSTVAVNARAATATVAKK